MIMTIILKETISTLYLNLFFTIKRIKAYLYFSFEIDIIFISSSAVIITFKYLLIQINKT